MRRLLLILLLVSSAFAVEYPDMRISALKTPTSVSPGGSFTIQIQAMNEGTGAAKRVEVYPDITKPFSIKPGTINQTFASDLRYGTSVISDFSFSVDSNVPAGVYKLKFYADYRDANDQKGRVSLEVPVNIQGSPLLETVGAETMPARAAPGTSGTLRISIRNVGTDTARNVRIIWAANSTVPIQPLAGAVSYLEALDNNDEKNLSLDFIVDGDAKPGNYPVALEILYHDAQHSEQTPLLRAATIVVEGKAELHAYVSEAVALTTGKPGKMTISVANTGSADARFLFAKITPSGMTASPTQAYLKTIAPNKDDTIDIDLQGDKPGKYGVKVQLIYKDQYNKDIVSEENFDVTVAEPTRGSRVADFLETWKYAIAAAAILAAAAISLTRKKEDAD